ncbi:MAG TPA: SH3 domain-containing protein, partial [Spirochaetota bacterium]|nr:SH3 domain-containing protein [Spirochaetota bacterium]
KYLISSTGTPYHYRMFRQTIITILFLALSACDRSPKSSRSESFRPEEEILYCIGTAVNVRENPEMNAKIIGAMKAGESFSFQGMSAHQTEITEIESLDKPTRRITDHWLRVTTINGGQGWIHGAYVGKRYFPRPRKRLANLPVTTRAWKGPGDNDIEGHSPYVFPIGCSLEGLIAFMFYPTMNPACGSSDVLIVDPKTNKTVWGAHHCGLEDVWDMQSTEINRKLNKFGIIPANFTLEKGPLETPLCRIVFSITPRTHDSMVSGYDLRRESGPEKSVIAKINFGEHRAEGVLLAGWIRNPCTGKIIVMVIRVSVGETFDFIETSPYCD